MALFPDYCTLAELRDFLSIADVTDTVDDNELSLAITTASRSIDKACGRQFGKVDSAVARYYSFDRYYPVALDTIQIMSIDDVYAVTGFGVATDTQNNLTYSTTVDTDDYALWPLNALANGKPYTHLKLRSNSSFPRYPDAIRVTALWGWTAVPAAVKEATLLQASRINVRRQSPYGISPAVEAGEQRLLSVLDPTVNEILRPYKRTVWAK